MNAFVSEFNLYSWKDPNWHVRFGKFLLVFWTGISLSLLKIATNLINLSSIVFFSIISSLPNLNREHE